MRDDLLEGVGGSLYRLRWSRGQVTATSSIRVISLDHSWINRLQLDVDGTLGGIGGTFQKLGVRRRSQGLADPTYQPIRVRFGLVSSRVLWNLLVYTWSQIDIFLFWTPNIASNISVLIISTSPSQWCTPINHLRYFYTVKIAYPTRQMRAPKLVELVRIKPYNYAL
jgi:hypothetical protein